MKAEVRINPKPSVKQIELTPNNPCKKPEKHHSHTKKLRDPGVPDNLPKSLDNCPCGNLESLKLSATADCQDWLNCDSCSQWYHRECLTISKKTYKKQYSGDLQVFHCLPCLYKFECVELTE